MKFPVVGLIFIFCLQAIFITYTNVDWIRRAPIAEVTLDRQYMPTIEVAAVPDQTGFTFAPATHILRRPAVINSDRFDTPARATFARSTYLAPRVVAYQKPEFSRPRFVEASRPVAPPQSISYELSASLTERPHKKSFLSKTFSIVKKPYDFVKFVGSKLN